MRFSEHMVVVALAGQLSMAMTASADDLGQVGPLYEIKEEDLISYIQRRMQRMQATGELERMKQEFVKKVEQRAREPTPVAGLKLTTDVKTFFVDPGVRTTDNIYDADGKLLYPAGTYRNPFDVVTMRHKLVFFDAGDPRQRAYARRIYDAEPLKPRLVLVAGKPFDLMNEWKIRIYYDQGGALVKKFGITQVPAVVSQEGRYLRVDEIKVN